MSVIITIGLAAITIGILVLIDRTVKCPCTAHHDGHKAKAHDNHRHFNSPLAIDTAKRVARAPTSFAHKLFNISAAAVWKSPR